MRYAHCAVLPEKGEIISLDSNQTFQEKLVKLHEFPILTLVHWYERKQLEAIYFRTIKFYELLHAIIFTLLTHPNLFLHVKK